MYYALHTQPTALPTDQHGDAVPLDVTLTVTESIQHVAYAWQVLYHN